MKLSLTTMLAVMLMLLLLAIHAAASTLTVPSGSDWNIGTLVTTTLPGNPTIHTPEKLWTTPTGSDTTFVTMISSEFSITTATSDLTRELEKKQSHDWFIDCQPGEMTITNLMDTSLSRTCLSAPYAYTCTHWGQLLYNQRNPICDSQCKCRKALPCPKAAIPIGIPCILGNVRGASGGGLDEIDNGSQGDSPSSSIDSIPTVSTTDQGDIATDTPAKLEKRDAATDTPIELEKRHDYFIDCTGNGAGILSSDQGRICIGRPYYFTCNDAGTLTFRQSNTICLTLCTCRKVQYCGKGAVLFPCGNNPPGQAGSYGLDIIEDNSVQGNSQASSIDLMPGKTSDENGITATNVLPRLEKRIEYTLTCTSDNIGALNLNATCTASPYDYRCNDSGGLVYAKANKECSADCHCYKIITGNAELDTNHKHKTPTKTLPTPTTVAQTISIKPEPQRTEAAVKKNEVVYGTIGTPKRRAVPGETIVCEDGGTIVPAVPGQSPDMICNGGEFYTIPGESVICAQGGTLVPVPGKEPNMVCTGGEITIVSRDLDNDDKTFVERYAVTTSDEPDEI